MTLKYKIFDELKLVYAVGTDTLSIDDLMSHMEELAKDSKYVSPMVKLIDYTNLKEYELTFEDSEKLAALKNSHAERFKDERFAIVVPSDISFGMARHNQAYINPKFFDSGVFRDLEEAKKWLGIELDDDELTVD